MASKYAAIFGASGALGQSFKELLASDHTIYSFSRNAQGDDIHFDLTDETSIDRAIKQIPNDIKFDMVIIATGMLYNDDIAPEKAIKQITAKNFTQVMQVNALGPALIAKYIQPHLSMKQPAHLVVLSARVGSISDNKLGGWHSYRASKAALNMLWRDISIELKRTHKQLTCLCLHPGTVDSHLSAPYKAHISPSKLFSPMDSTQNVKCNHANKPN